MSHLARQLPGGIGPSARWHCALHRARSRGRRVERSENQDTRRVCRVWQWVSEGEADSVW